MLSAHPLHAPAGVVQSTGENNKSRLLMSNHSYFAPTVGTQLRPSC